MNDDRNDQSNDPAGHPPASDPVIPAGSASPHTPPPPPPSEPGATSVPPPPPASAAPTTPADYYAQPPVDAPPKSGCKKWLIGCGAAGCLVGILLIVGGFWLVRSGWPMLMTRMVTEVETHIADHGDEIDPAVRDELEIELGELKRHIEDGDVGLEQMQGVVYSMQDIVGDDSISTMEAEEFLEELKRVNESGATGEF